MFAANMTFMRLNNLWERVVQSEALDSMYIYISKRRKREGMKEKLLSILECIETENARRNGIPESTAHSAGDPLEE